MKHKVTVVPNPKPGHIDEAMELAERHHAKASGLVAGATRLLSDFINGTSWGTEIAIDAAIELLHEARVERERAKQSIRERPHYPARARTRTRRQTKKRKP